MTLTETLQDPSKKTAVVADCGKLIDAEVADKGGLSGLAVKAGYAVVKGIKPGFISHTVEKLLPEFAKQLDPFWTEGKQGGDPKRHILANKSKVADALLTVTDGKIKDASGAVKGAYERLRGSAKKNVEEALPRLADLLARHGI
jgi:hypothetical protein